MPDITLPPTASLPKPTSEIHPVPDGAVLTVNGIHLQAPLYPLPGSGDVSFTAKEMLQQSVQLLNRFASYGHSFTVAAMAHGSAPRALYTVNPSHPNWPIEAATAMAAANGWCPDAPQRAGIYYSVALPSAGAASRPKITRKQVGGIVLAHFDLDPLPPPTNATDIERRIHMAAERARLVRRGQQISSDEFPPTVTIISGCGVHGLYFLERLVPVSIDAMAEVEAINRALLRVHNAPEGTFNADHLLRVPGLVNWVSEGKRALGRCDDWAWILAESGRTYTLAELTAQFCKANELQESQAHLAAKLGKRIAVSRSPAALPRKGSRKERTKERQLIDREALEAASILAACPTIALQTVSEPLGNAIIERPELWARFHKALADDAHLAALWRDKQQRNHDRSDSGVYFEAHGLLKAHNFTAVEAVTILEHWLHRIPPAAGEEPITVARFHARCWLRSRGGHLPHTEVEQLLAEYNDLGDIDRARLLDTYADGALLKPTAFRDLAKARLKPRAHGPGRLIIISDPEIVTGKLIDGADLFHKIMQTKQRFFFLPPGAAVVTAFYPALSHVIDVIDHFARLLYLSRKPGSGKSNAMIYDLQLCARATPAGSFTTASIPRLLDAMRPYALGFDDADDYLARPKDNITALLNSGWTRATAQVTLNVKIGDNYVPRLFPTDMLMFYTMLEHPKPALVSRSIVVTMPGIPPKEARPSGFPDFEVFTDQTETSLLLELRNMLWTWAQARKSSIGERIKAGPAIPDALQRGRTADNYRALFAIADEAGGGWPRLLRDAAVELESHSAVIAPVDLGDALLADCYALRAALIRSGDASDRISSADLANHLNGLSFGPAEYSLFDRSGPWPRMPDTHRPLDQDRLAAILRPARIISDSRQFPDGRRRGYIWGHFEQAWRELGLVWPPEDMTR